MKALQESDVLRIMQEEWDNRVNRLAEAVEVVMTAPVEEQGTEEILSPDLKVRHKKSGIRYTIASVGPRDVILKTPEGEEFLVDGQELENEYILD